MPRFPHVSPSVASIQGSVYTALAHKLATYEGGFDVSHGQVACRQLAIKLMVMTNPASQQIVSTTC